MQNKELIVIGIDVSKKTLDVCLKGKEIESLVINNNEKCFRVFITKLFDKYEPSQIHIGFENTGMYNYVMYRVLEELQLNVYIFNPLDLHRSIGMVRGKSDKVDAQRIASYLFIHLPELVPSIVPNKRTLLLKALFAKRKKLVAHRTALKTSNKELVSTFGKIDAAALLTTDNAVLVQIDKAIKLVEKQIQQILNEDEKLKQKVSYASSVQGVGPVLASYLAIKTNGFTVLTDPRKLACYAGVVPFKNQSGTSVYKRPKVSYMADKQLKKLLHMAAMRVIQLPGDLRDYYIRKVKEGKNKMSVLNAIRNKLIARICSCVNNNKNYQVNLQVS